MCIYIYVYLCPIGSGSLKNADRGHKRTEDFAPDTIDNIARLWAKETHDWTLVLKDHFGCGVENRL